MKKYIIKIIFLQIIILLTTCIFTGCKSIFPEITEMKDKLFVLALAIDRGTEDKKNVRITIIAKNLSGVTNSKGSQGMESMEHVYSAEGKTVGEAYQNFHIPSSKHSFLGHNRYILLSEEVAKENISETLDFFIRDYETRETVHIIIVKGSRAEKILYSNNTNINFAPDLLKDLFNKVGSLSISKDFKFFETLALLDNEYASVYLPYIQMNPKNSEVELNGFAVFKGTKLLDFISDGTSRGVSFITGDIKSGIIIVKSDDDKNVLLDINEESSKIKSEFVGNLPVVTINIKVSCNITEQQTNEDISKNLKLENLVKNQNDLIKNDVESAISFAQKNGVDILGIGDSIYHSHPLKWDKIKDNWKTIFPKIKINVVVESRISRYYMFNKPMITKSGENK